MIYQKFKRCLSFALALLLAVSLMPVSALGAEAEGTPTEETAATQPAETTTLETETTEETQISSAEPEISDAVLALQARIDALLALYGIEDTMTDEDIFNSITQADGDTIQWTMTERESIGTDTMTLTNEEILTLELDLYERFWNVFDPLFTPAPASGETVSVTGVSGVTVGCDSKGTAKESGGTVTITATTTNWGATRSNTKVTITNTSGSAATISFSHTESAYDSGVTTLDDMANPYSADLAAGGTITFQLCSSRNPLVGYTATAKLSGFSVVIASEHNVEVSFDSSKGKVSRDGTNISAGTYQVEASTFVATPNADATFLGWIDPDTHEIISTEASYFCTPKKNMKLQAVFAGNATSATNSPWFKVNDTHLYEGLDAATGMSGAKTVVLMNNGTLPASTSNDGVYTIPAGVTLLIPYDAAGTLCTAKPSEHENAYTAPSVFRTLTMANGSNITVNGAISISGSISSKYGNIGMPSGPYGKINMNSGSKITVNGSAKLYAWGYITGAGSVEINNGGHVYECFQVADYRGGDATTQIVGKDDEYGVFPFNQYYVQNVEVPMTLHAGATETGYGAVYVRMAGHQPMSIPFIGNVENQSMFVISSGYIIKDYMEGTGRTKMGIYGDLKVTKVNVDIKVSLIGDISIDSSKYALPIPQHFNISLESGSVTMNQNVAFFPGSELYIREGTTCTLGSGKKIYVYDLDQWLYNEGKNGYSGTTNLPYMQLKHVPGGDGTTGRLKDALIQIDGTVDASAGSVYVTSGGANIYSTGTGKVIVGSAPDTTVRQVITNGTDVSSWPEIPIVPAILQNAAGKDPASTNTAETTGTYVYRNGIWCPHTDTVYRDSNKDHKCDTCGTVVSGCFDGNKDHKCDTCGMVMSQCSDVTSDGNHTCDICGADGITEHTMLNGVCTDCGAAYEAQIGSTYYWTLAEAVSAASPGADISLLKNVETAVTVDKPLIILRSANKYTVNLSTADGLFLCTSDAAYAVTKGFTLRSAECSYEAEVVLRMKLYIPDVFLDGDYTIRLIKDGRFGKVETLYTMAELKAAGADKNGLYWAMAGVASGEMTCNVAIDIQDGSGNPVTIYQPNGNEVGDSFTYTVKQYVDGVLASGLSENHKAAANALAVYGGYAQQYFNVSPDKLAYEGLEMPDLNTVTADAVGHAVTYTGSEAGITVKSIEPFLDSATYLRLKFLITDGSDISNFTFTTTDAKGNSQTLKAFYEEESKRYCVDIPDIHAVYLDHTYTVTVTNNTTSKAHTVNASVLSWVNLAISKSTDTKQVNMAKALYLYNQAADTLFGE